MYTDKEINDLYLEVNRICYGQKFINAFIDKFKFCPNGLTYDFDIYKQFSDEPKFKWWLTVKQYGYEHSCNNGVSVYSDFKQNEFDFYYKYMLGQEFK